MISGRSSKVNRVLRIYSDLLNKDIVNKKCMANLFNVTEKTIQRDIEDVRAYLYDHIDNIGLKEVVYSRNEKGYKFDNNEDSFTKGGALSIIKILLESRAFSKEELNYLVNSIIEKLSLEQRKHIKKIVGNELYNYVPIKHNNLLISKIWDLSDIIKNKETIEIEYIRMDGKSKKRNIKPVSIIFSEYYFYLIAYFKDFSSPAIYRIDRIKEYKKIGEKFYISYSERFEDGEFRKRIQFMYPGKIIKIKFEFTGPSIESVLDRLPTAKIIQKSDDKYTVEAEVYGKGIIMWILSQGQWIKVISPKEIVDEITIEIDKMKNQYIN